MDTIKRLASSALRHPTLNFDGVDIAGAVISKNNRARYVLLNYDEDTDTLFIPEGVAGRVRVYGDSAVDIRPDSCWSLDNMARARADHVVEKREVKIHLALSHIGLSACSRPGKNKTANPHDVTCGRCRISKAFKRAVGKHRTEFVEGFQHLVWEVKKDGTTKPCGFCGKSHEVGDMYPDGHLKDFACSGAVGAIMAPNGELIPYDREVLIRFL